ncbi:MAG: LysM peptidoglycan-binding domain-containing protein [Thermodesulfobacteriota bacterium]
MALLPDRAVEPAPAVGPPGAVSEEAEAAEAAEVCEESAEALEALEALEAWGLPVPDRPEIGAVLDEFAGMRGRGLGEVFRRGARYLPMIRHILAEEGLPEELAYVALVESSFHPDARSPANAVGMWQFIESTGRASGLRIDWWVDERLDPEASTRAAAAHLKELYARFGDWNLALAAYNAGPGGVSRAQAAARAECFWELSAAGALRAETRRYVPKFYAAVQMARDPEAHGLPAGTAAAPPSYETVWVDAPVDLRTAARLAGAALAELRALNPALRRGCTPPGTQAYPLRVPAGTAGRLAQGLAAIPASERLTFRRYQVRPGDTLWEIARSHGAPAAAVAELNAIADPRRLRPGQEVVIPVPRGGAGSEPALKTRAARSDEASEGAATYVVRPGDTVWGIARQQGVSSEDLMRWNGLDRRGRLRPGDRLVLGSGAETGRAVGSTRDAPRPRVASGERVHVVRQGESLWGIARQYGVPLAQLLERNGLEPSSILRPGDRVVVDGGLDPS